MATGQGIRSTPVFIGDGGKALYLGDGDVVKGAATKLPYNVTISPAAGGANESDVTITVVDKDGDAIARVHQLKVWLSDAATGAGLTATSASGTVQAKSASGADFAALTAKKALIVQTLATGVYVLEITDSAKTLFYVCVENPFTGETIVGDKLVSGDYGS